MISAKPGNLAGLKVSHGALLPRGVWSIEQGGQTVEEDISTATKISTKPLLEDVHDAKTVYVAESSIPGAAEGVFMKRNLGKGSLAAIYNGVRMTTREARKRKEDRKSQYRIHGWGDMVLNVPPAFVDTRNYTASLGHKVNHAKSPNSEFRFLWHPRFGEIVGVYLTRDLVAGQELTANYGYMEKYMATEAGIQMLLNVGQAVAGIQDKQEFHREMKRTISFVREQVENIKPFVETFKMARTFL